MDNTREIIGKVFRKSIIVEQNQELSKSSKTIAVCTDRSNVPTVVCWEQFASL